MVMLEAFGLDDISSFPRNQWGIPEPTTEYNPMDNPDSIQDIPCRTLPLLHHRPKVVSGGWIKGESQCTQEDQRANANFSSHLDLVIVPGLVQIDPEDL